MNAQVATQWVAALRSGEFAQTYGRLRETIDDSPEPSYCVLGVLCELHRRSAPDAMEWEPLDGAVGDWEYMGNRSLAPIPVLEWAGLRRRGLDIGPLLRREPEDEPNVFATFAEANDEYGIDFGRLADLIEANADRL